MSARIRASAARVPACPDAGRAPRTGAAVELGLPGGGGRAAAGRPRSLRSARRSAHGKQQRGPAESRAYGGVKPETPKRNPPYPATLRSTRLAAPQEAAAGTEEARARARRGGGGSGAAAAARRSTAGPASRRAPATMNFLLTWIRWGLAALLYLQSAEVSGGTGAFVPPVAEGEGRQTADNTFPPFFVFLCPPFASHLLGAVRPRRWRRVRVGARGTDTCACGAAAGGQRCAQFRGARGSGSAVRSARSHERAPARGSRRGRGVPPGPEPGRGAGRQRAAFLHQPRVS